MFCHLIDEVPKKMKEKLDSASFTGRSSVEKCLITYIFAILRSIFTICPQKFFSRNIKSASNKLNADLSVAEKKSQKKAGLAGNKKFGRFSHKGLILTSFDRSYYVECSYVHS